MTRPTGVTILAILAAIAGVFGLLGGLTLVGVGGMAGGVIGGAAGAAIGGLAVIGGLIVIVLAVLELALAYGFWTLRPWAWQLGVILAAIQIVVAVLGVLGIVFRQDLGGAVISIAISGVILYYLNQAEIRRVFNAPEKGFPGFPDGLPGMK
jgi:hypothetical protein